jgi:hypothetical protein
MAESSINFKPVKANSTRHNERIGELDYVYPDLTKNNSSWKTQEVDDRYKEIAALTKEKTKRKIQAKATPIREAVVNLNSHHKMDDLKKLAKELEAAYGIQCFQIHIHRDEGKSETDLNYHAHMLFDWQDKETGKSFKYLRADMSKIQDLVAKSLSMVRGKKKENSVPDRLEAVEYKISKEEEKRIALQEQNEILEQKKNEVRARIEKLRTSGEGIATQEDIGRQKEAIRDIFLASTSISEEDERKLLSFDEIALSEAIKEFEGEVNTTAQRIESFTKNVR